jgi:hypothetical protein
MSPFSSPLLDSPAVTDCHSAECDREVDPRLGFGSRICDSYHRALAATRNGEAFASPVHFPALTYPEELQDLPKPYFIGSARSKQTWVLDVEVELLLERFGEFPDFRAMVAFDRRLTRKLSGDSEIGRDFATTSLDSLNQTGRSMLPAARLLLPGQLECPESGE